MGNEQSSLSGIDIEDEAMEVSNFWSHHSATIFESNNLTNLTVFIEDSSQFTSDALWSPQTPLEKCTKNLMVYRHPCIVKYVGSWHKNSKFFLAVENVTPLHHMISFMSNAQISVGLYSILKALLFLHENALVSHNNISISSVYVSKDGTWKLGGMEYLCKYDKLTPKYLEQSKSSRYNKAVDENEGKQLNRGKTDFIDVYAFGVLAQEVLKTEDDILPIKSFCDYCKNELQNCDVTKRPNLASILNHPFFNQDFILIYSFLVELPLKSDAEKLEFFPSLCEKLKTFDENLVASILGGFLLSRMVLTNTYAQKDLVPCLLTPQTDNNTDIPTSGLFTMKTFQEHIAPKLIDIFKVHEVQIRLLLLQYLPKFVMVFTKDELQKSILPELLVGIKDTNDKLVAATLKSLADLVPLLGSEIVIGGKRAKLFNDGRRTDFANTNRPKQTARIQTPVSRTAQQTVVIPVLTESTNLSELSERPRPDGEEGTDSQEFLQTNDDDLDKWDDWTTNENDDDLDAHTTAEKSSNPELQTLKVESKVPQSMTKKSIADIDDLDIKNQVRSKNDDIDFFGDMEPVIDSSNKFLIDEQNDIILEKEINSKLAFNTNENSEEGWGDEWESTIDA